MKHFTSKIRRTGPIGLMSHIGLISLMGLVGIIGCSVDESLELCELTVQLTYEKTAFAEPTDAQVRVELRDAYSSVFVDSTDTDRTVRFRVPPGIYEASTASQYIDSTETVWWRYMFNGTRSLIVVDPDSTNQVEMNVRVSRKRVIH